VIYGPPLAVDALENGVVLLDSGFWENLRKSSKRTRDY